MSFFSSLLGNIHADAPQEQEQPPASAEAAAEAEAEEAEAKAEAEEEEPEDVRFFNSLLATLLVSEPGFLNPQIHPKLREEAQESSKCKASTQHFLHCQEKVQSGKGFKHEDCVEEM